MHTYRKSGANWIVIFKWASGSSGETQISSYNNEADAAARVNYLNGGPPASSGIPSNLKVLATS